MVTRGFFGGSLVLIGGVVISTLPLSSALAQIALIQSLRETESGRMAGLALVLLGLALYAAAWLRLCRHVAHAKDDDLGDAVTLVHRAALVWSLPLVLAPPLFSRDGWSYAAQGMLTHYGISPYEHGPGVLAGPIVQSVDPRWLETAAPYGPLPLVYGSVVASLTGNPWTLVVAHRLLALAGLALLAWSVPRLAQWSGINPALASAVVLCSPLMLAHGVGGLHNDLFMVGLMTSALVLAAERGWVWGAAVAGLAAAVKLPGGLVGVGVALLALPVGASLALRVGRLAQVAVVAAVVLALSGVLSGLGDGWVHALGVPASVRVPLSLSTGLGSFLDVLSHWLGFGLEPGVLLGLVRGVAQFTALGIASLVALRTPSGSRVDAMRAVATVMGAVILLGPVVHPWYFLWAVPFPAVLRMPRVGTGGLLAAEVIFGVAAPLDSSLHGAYVAIVVGTMLTTALVLSLLVTRTAQARIETIAKASWLPTTPQPETASRRPAKHGGLAVPHLDLRIRVDFIDRSSAIPPGDDTVRDQHRGEVDNCHRGREAVPCGRAYLREDRICGCEKSSAAAHARIDHHWVPRPGEPTRSVR